MLPNLLVRKQNLAKLLMQCLCMMKIDRIFGVDFTH